MKILLLLSALLLGCSAAQAQQALPLASAPASAPPAPALDSVAVLHQLFRHYRRPSRFLVAIGGYQVGAGVSALSAGGDHQPLLGGLLAGVGGTNVVMYIVRWARYSRRHEEEAVQLLRQGQLLPRYVRGPYMLALLNAQNHPRKH